MTPNAKLANLALGLFSFFAVVLILLHILRPDYTPVDHMISDYAVGRFGWLMTCAFVAIGLGCLSVAVALWQAGPRAVLARAGSVLLTIACIGLMVTAIFPTDLESAPVTAHGNIHTLSFLVNILSILLATFAISISLGKDTTWRARRPVFLIMALIVLGGFVAQILTLHRGAPYGITNRLFVAVLLLWLISMAWQLRKAAPRNIMSAN